MIYNLCQTENDHRLFDQISIYQVDDIGDFDEIDSPVSILSILNAMPNTGNALHLQIAPNIVDLSIDREEDNLTTFYDNEISFPLTPLDANLKELLERYEMRRVVVLMKKSDQWYLLGTKLKPLTFRHSFLYTPDQSNKRGYNINISGATYHEGIYFTQAQIDADPINNGLAFELAQSL